MTGKRPRLAVHPLLAAQETERRDFATRTRASFLFPCGYFFESIYNCAQRRSMCIEKFNIFLQFPK
jgi:hypothetical protein